MPILAKLGTLATDSQMGVEPDLLGSAQGFISQDHAFIQRVLHKLVHQGSWKGSQLWKGFLSLPGSGK